MMIVLFVLALLFAARVINAFRRAALWRAHHQMIGIAKGVLVSLTGEIAMVHVGMLVLTPNAPVLTGMTAVTAVTAASISSGLLSLLFLWKEGSREWGS